MVFLLPVFIEAGACPILLQGALGYVMLTIALSAPENHATVKLLRELYPAVCDWEDTVWKN
jgi:hypothetical protein